MKLLALLATSLIATSAFASAPSKTVVVDQKVTEAVVTTTTASAPAPAAVVAAKPAPKHGAHKAAIKPAAKVEVKGDTKVVEKTTVVTAAPAK